MSGSEQFLGRQLQTQAKALQDIVLQGTTQVDALIDMTNALDRMTPKFAKASTVVRSQRSYGSTEMNIRGSMGMGYTFIPYLSGTIRISMTLTTEYAVTVSVAVNGVIVNSFDTISGVQTRDVDLNIQDGDVVNIYSHGGADIYLTNIKIKYDLIDKPDVSL